MNGNEQPCMCELCVPDFVELDASGVTHVVLNDLANCTSQAEAVQTERRNTVSALALD